MSWTEKHVRRLFWRAGFGATPAEARHWSRRGKARTIRWLLNGGRGPRVRLPEPSVDGRPLDPENEWGHDALWWLDRMVRSDRPLVEKMTLFWHDHFATRDQDTPLMLRQNWLLRRHALGSFHTLVREVTRDTAMLLFLSLAGSDKEKPNENYARELMELFCLGSGYSEDDIREAARALTGFVADYPESGLPTTYYDTEAHDGGVKRIYGRRGRFEWEDVIELTIAHPRHAPFLVEKLWDWFTGIPIDRATRARLVRMYKGSNHRVKPVVGAILAHPALYRRLDGPDLIKPPVVLVAGALRSLGQGVTRDEWTWVLSSMGQQLFFPLSVAGWESGPSWLSSNSMHVRFDVGNHLLDRGPGSVPDGSAPVQLTPKQAVALARQAVGGPWTSANTDRLLASTAHSLLSDPELREEGREKQRQDRADMTQRVLRHLLLAGPDAQVH